MQEIFDFVVNLTFQNLLPPINLMLLSNNFSFCFHRLREIIPTADGFREEIKYVESMLSDLDLPHGLCHRDVHGRNMAYDETADTLVLFDYETAIYGILAYDIAYFLNIFLYKDFHGKYGIQHPTASTKYDT